ncbi:hypothetical protein JZM39_14385 [Acinetobacter pittii]|uniref:hypothetical protein n=1 Tax=Acinetobacter pittii TaxID=48296 RepID=UPI00197DD87F|nr:hypothetical protein [Acinetobacter pittii]MBN6536959.1 hypothetical protein [Acinetobacter pittii]
MDNIDVMKQLESFERTINEIQEISNENKNNFSYVIDVLQNGDTGITVLIPKDYDFSHFNLGDYYQNDSLIKESLDTFTTQTINFKRSLEIYKTVPYASLLNPKLNYELNQYLNSFKNINKTIKNLGRKSELLQHELVYTNLEEVIKDKKNEKFEYIFELVKEILQLKTSILNDSNILFIDFELTVQSFEFSIKETLAFEKKKHDNQTEYFERLKEEQNLLIKQFRNEISNLTEKYNNQIRNYELDIDKIKKSSELLITGVDSGLKSLNELNEKSQKLELDFSTIINEKKTKIDEDLKIKILDIDNQFNALRSRLNTRTEKIKNSQKDLMKLLEKTSLHKLTDNYKTKADKEEKAYKNNSRITIGAIISAIITTIIIIGLPIYEYWKHVPPIEPNFYTIVARLTVSLMFFVLAIYTSKQAAKHYECFQENYRTYLQLAALEPFMSRMSEEEQKDIRKGLIPTYFNQNSDSKFSSKGEEVGLPTSFNMPIEKVAELLKPFLDKASDPTKPNS